MKVNVANYLIGDLSNRFPISSRNPIDNDLIDVMVEGADLLTLHEELNLSNT